MAHPNAGVQGQRLSLDADIMSDWFERPKEGADSPYSVPLSYVLGLAADLEDLFSSRGVDVTPVVRLRALDVITWSYIAREIQGKVSSDGIAEGETQKDNNGTEKKTGWRLHAAVEALAKTWERLRKAMKELEDTCKNAGTPVNNSLAAAVQPLLERAEGVLEDALEYEKKKMAENSSEQATTEC